jgi:TRAP-type C4-dicarboxylate transport system substrate-binding protein
MARHPQMRGGRASRAASNARRLWPYVLMAWERWQSLPPEQKERYKRQAREYAQRGRKAVDERRRKR